MAKIIKITEDLIPVGRRNRPGLALVAKGVTVHNSGNRHPDAGPTMMAKYAKGVDAANREASWHYNVGKDHPNGPVLIIRSLPESEVSWHAGDGRNGPGNRTTISIEIAENVIVDGQIDPEVLEASAWLVADICGRYGWDTVAAAA